MILVDLGATGHYPPLDSRTPSELFDLAVEIAEALEDVSVRVPVGETPEESVVLTSRLMRRCGAKVF
ncbi:hypothetical protein [Magnetospirillum aberrantis]|uniref:Uncharacterized protein n=1 Tax=Magnetospirillum aberrantis SpK TaxID=908842 RepID=A0A7C9UW93_9PROT|nr:hypothetical protein [Magnetospirillum aberrantis]NFV81506.1 hypothetical protein [Magnetospirillum aberrantis SpK]